MPLSCRSPSLSQGADRINLSPAKAESLVLPPQYSRRLLLVSFLTPFSVLLALHYELYDLALVATFVFIHSVNYWRHPTFGLRRKVDMVTALFGCIYQFYRAKDSTLPVSYFAMVTMGVLCYYMARRSGPDKTHGFLVAHWNPYFWKRFQRSLVLWAAARW